MSRESLGLPADLHSYLLSVSVRESEALRALREETARHPYANMQIAAEQGALMAILVKLTQAKRILEVGTFTGYSALSMAAALPDDGKLLTLDINKKTGQTARRFWEAAGVSHKIEQRIGPALETMRALQDSFDLIFIDADKSNYDLYYERGLELLAPGGALLIDNVLWGGRVTDPDANDADTEAIRALNQKIHSDGRVDCCMVPIADGLTIVRRRSP